MVLRHQRSSRSEVIADLLTPRFEVMDDEICVTFTIAAINATQVSLSLLTATSQLSDLASAYYGDVRLNNESVDSIKIPVSPDNHYLLFSVRKEHSNIIAVTGVELSNNCLGKTISFYSVTELFC